MYEPRGLVVHDMNLAHLLPRRGKGRGWRLLAPIALALAFLAFLASAPSPASARERVVIHGAHSGSTLRLHMRGNRLVVRGLMTHRAPRGCRFTKGRVRARCSMRGVRAIRIKMGPSGDMVRILERMPVRVVALLGPGSDKFIGNSERDYCYSQGSRRNRCIGRGGRDVCITGPRNSDCVGGRGNDYCKHSTGSDGCWGGPGRDICIMGPGHDGCHGGGGKDRLWGGPSSDRLYGGPGYDYCNGQGARGYSTRCETGPRR